MSPFLTTILNTEQARRPISQAEINEHAELEEVFAPWN